MVKFSPDTDIPSLDGKVALITGGNSGLGLATARQLLRHKVAHVFLACRSKSNFDQAVQELQQQGYNTDLVSFISMDLASLASVRSAATAFKATSSRLDILFNNAGVMMMPEGLTEDGYEIQFGTNHLGHAYLVHLLFPTIEETAKMYPDVRIIFVSSAGEMMAPKDPYQAERLKTTMPNISTTARYGVSKLANIHYAASLAERYPSIKVISIHPGIVDTNLATPYKNNSLIMGTMVRVFNSIMAVHPDKGCLNQLWAATSPEAESGVFYYPVGVKSKGSKMAQDKAARNHLWQWTQEEIKTLPSATSDT